MVVRGQYIEGLCGGEKAKSYRDEDHVAPDSNIETFVALKCYIENWRWAGVPFYLRTGKRLPRRASEIAIYFKQVPRILYNARPAPVLPPELSLDSYPARRGPRTQYHFEGSGQTLRLNPVDSRFPLQDRLDAGGLRNAAERRHRRRSDALHAARYGRGGVAFRAGDPRCVGESPIEPPIYAAGSWGPLESALLIARTGALGERFSGLGERFKCVVMGCRED